MALTTGNAKRVNNPIKTAEYVLSTLRIDAPRYANTKASHM